MKNLKLFTVVLLVSAVSISCKKKEIDEPSATPIVLDCNAFKSNNANSITLLKDMGDGIDYIIDCIADISVDLVIEPGVTIAFASDAGFRILEEGSLNAQGLTNNKVVFTGVDKVKGSWRGIICHSSDVKNRFENVLIEYAGGNAFNSNNDRGAFILWSQTYARFQNVEILNSATYGINAIYNNSSIEITNCTIAGCDMAMFLNPNYASKISGGNFTGNSKNAVRLNGGTGVQSISGSQTWSDIGVPYRVKGQIMVNGSLVISAGVEVEFETAAGLRINEQGSLVAVGTETNNILFTGVDKLPGAWDRIYFNFTTSPLNEIAFCTIEYAGTPSSGGSIFMWANPVVNVHDVLFRNLAQCALYAAPSTSSPNINLTESNNTTENVAGGYLCGS